MILDRDHDLESAFYKSLMKNFRRVKKILSGHDSVKDRWMDGRGDRPTDMQTHRRKAFQIFPFRFAAGD